MLQNTWEAIKRHTVRLKTSVLLAFLMAILVSCSLVPSPIATIKVAVTKPAMAICPSPDGKMIVAIFQREPALLIDVEKRQVIKSFEKVYRCAAWDTEAGCILLGGDSGVDVVSESDWHVKSSTLELVAKPFRINLAPCLNLGYDGHHTRSCDGQTT